MKQAAMVAADKERLWNLPFTLTMFGMFFLFIPFSLYMPVMPVYLLNELHSSLQQAGSINGIFLLAVVLSRALTASLEARFGIRRVLLICAFLFMVTNALYLFATSISVVMLIRFFSGACFAVANTSIMSLSSRLIPRSRIGEGLAYLTTTVLAGGAVGPYIGLNLSHAFGYKAVFIFTALSSLLGVLIMCAIPVHETEKKSAPRFTFTEMFEVKAIPISVLVFVLAIAYGGVLTFVAVYSTELRLPVVTEYFFAVMATVSVVSRLATGRMFDRFGAKVAINLAMILLGGGLLLLGGIHSTAGMLTAAALIGIGYGIVTPSFQTLAIKCSPIHRSSAVTATYFTCLDGGIGAGAYLVGGGIHLFGYSAVYAGLGVVIFFCVPLFYIVYKRMHGA